MSSLFQDDIAGFDDRKITFGVLVDKPLVLR